MKALKIVLTGSLFILGSNAISLKKVEHDFFQIEKEDETHFKTSSVAKMIQQLQPKISVKKRIDVATLINKTAKKYKISPKILVAIIDTESRFDKNMISKTGDISMAQINVEIWNEEFQRLNMPLIDKAKMKTDVNYSLEVMGEIMQLLKRRYAHRDHKWFARYHSGNKKFKQIYLAKVEDRLAMIK